MNLCRFRMHCPAAAIKPKILMLCYSDSFPPAGPPKTHFLQGEAYFSENLPQQADLEVVQSFATEFSWTSRFQNRKLQCLNSILYDFHQNRPNERRDIHDFVKYFLENPHGLFATICPGVIL